MTGYTESNARISSVKLDIDRGYLSGWVSLDFGGSAQCFGGAVLYSEKYGEDFAGRFIARVLETVGVETWEGLAGKPCRARWTNEKVYAIGHFLKDSWFHIEEDLK